ncbi:hypothetical protein BSPCLSOX_541 [uncultured Gammaproteobacteria bacterium]|jgi:hypothetical protein|nr:hypothetical protein [uncultured Gammaproteobacteria bacterium]VVH56708.1 hypothetical protein BSPCLSOX_541 [uncultured Gammaproteobacteria bacterium]
MKSIVLFVLTLNLTGCFTGLLTPKTWFNQDEYLHFLYKDRQEGYISSNVIPICKYRHCKKMSEDAIYVEYYYNFIAFRSRYKGTCTTIFKARKSDNIIVSWRFEGRKYDCLLY